MPTPGGRAGRLDVGGYRIDTGPTVLTMPDLVAETLAAVGEELTDRLDLVRLDPAYRAAFADGSTLDVHTDAEAMTDAVEAFAGPAEAAGYRRLRAWLTELYQREFSQFIAANFDSPLSLVTPNLARLAGLGAFRRLEPAIGRFIHDERLRRVFSFQSLYAGESPSHALAVYAVIAYMDTVAGVYFPRGGMRAVPDALAGAAASAGREAALRRGGHRAGTIRGPGHGRPHRRGMRVPCDAVVLATELDYRLPAAGPASVAAGAAAPRAVRGGAAHGNPPDLARDRSSHDLVRPGLAADVHARSSTTGSSCTIRRCWSPGPRPPTRDSRRTAPTCCTSWPRPRTWPAAGSTGTGPGRLCRRAGRHRRGPAAARAGDRGQRARTWSTPADWARQGMVAGTPFSFAHSFGQSGPFRPGNLPRGVDNVVLAGCGTVPGVGVPTALVSGRLAADRITGPREPGAPPGPDRPSPSPEVIMIGAELDAAGMADPQLRAAYRRCRELNARHGKTYYLATKLLTRAQRPAVHALYGFARMADDIVDDVPPGTTPDQVAARLDQLRRDLFDRRCEPGTARTRSWPRWSTPPGVTRLAPDLFGDFMDSMRMDLEVTSYPDRAALDRYVRGSAEVIGLQVLPVLGTVGPQHEAAPYAAALGKAFQLTNFLRDVAEDLDRGRVYLPADELAAFGVGTDLLRWCRAHQRTDRRVRAALADQHATTRAIYRYARRRDRPAAAGVPALREPPRWTLYSRDPGPHRGPRLRGVRPAGPGREGPAASGRGARLPGRCGPAAATAPP